MSIMNYKVLPVLFTILNFQLFIYGVSSYKILGVFTFASPSHYFLGNELLKGLTKAGHETTILTVFEEKNPPPANYTQIILDDILDIEKATIDAIVHEALTGQPDTNFIFNPIAMVYGFNEIVRITTERVLNHTKTQKLIESKSKFDVVIIPQFFYESFKALAPHFDAHLVLFNNHAATIWMNHFVGNPSIPSFTSDFRLGYGSRMNFQQRLINTIGSIMQYSFFNFFLYPTQADVVRKYISEDLDLNKLLYNVSLVLSNSHSSLVDSKSSVPCMKEIAGFHVNAPKKLPEDLQQYLDTAKDGVIYFSMGSNVKSSQLSADTKRALLKAFAKRKEKVLWKFDQDDLAEKPLNVKIGKWFPQSDLLAHPNIKLFITHGGFLSIIETLYHGVPIITIPVFGDQPLNANKAEQDGYGKVIDFKTLTEESISLAIEEVISNKKYRENVKARSKIFHDRQIKPMDEAIYWIEYIVRHNGADHLKVGYIDLSWYQYYLLDVFAVIFAVIFSVFFIIKTIISFILRTICKNNKGETKKVKKL